MSDPEYFVGSEAELQATWRNLLGALADPGDPTIIVRTPSGIETEHAFPGDSAVVKDSTGVYHLDQVLTESGTWYYRGKSESGIVAARERFLTVKQSRFDNP